MDPVTVLHALLSPIDRHPKPATLVRLGQEGFHHPCKEHEEVPGRGGREGLGHPEQVEEVLRIRETMLLQVGVDQKVEDLLVKKGFLDEERPYCLRRDVAGLKVGKYQILERLPTAVDAYKAVQLPLQRTVAIKLLSRGARQRPGVPRSIPPRGPDRRYAEPSEHRPRSRLRRGRRLPLFRDGVRGGRAAPEDHQPGGKAPTRSVRSLIALQVTERAPARRGFAWSTGTSSPRTS